MSRFFTVLLTLSALCSLGFGYSGGLGSSNYSNTPPSYTSCVSCHSGHALNSGTGVLSVGGLPTSGYTPGQTYNIILTLRQNSMYRWGFQQTTQLASNSALGGGHLTSSSSYVSATNGGTGPDYANQTTAGTFAGTQNGPVTWNITWVAPTAGSGNVLFYTVGLAANNNNASSGDYGYARVDTVREFGGQLPPNQFALSTPAMGAFFPSGSVSFGWQANGDPNVGDVVTYKLFWSLDSNFFNFDSSSNVGVASITLNNFTSGNRYYWKVRAVDNHGNSRWCLQPFSFDYNVQRPPNPFGLATPLDSAATDSLPILFSWHRTVDPNPGDVVSYTLLKTFSSVGTFGDTLYTGPDTSFSWNGALSDSSYLWVVVASDQHGNQISATQRSFVYFIPTPPTGNINLLAPADSVTIYNPMVLFSWSPITDNDPGDIPQYELWLQQGTDSVNFVNASDTNLVVTLTDVSIFQWDQPITWWAIGYTLHPYVTVYSTTRRTLFPSSGVSQHEALPMKLQLANAYPNPFNSTTHLSLSLPHAAPVSGILYNMIGQAVGHYAWGTLSAGNHDLSFSGSTLASGTYLLRCQIGNEFLSRSFTLLK